MNDLPAYDHHAVWILSDACERDNFGLVMMYDAPRMLSFLYDMALTPSSADGKASHASSYGLNFFPIEVTPALKSAIEARPLLYRLIAGPPPPVVPTSRGFGDILWKRTFSVGYDELRVNGWAPKHWLDIEPDAFLAATLTDPDVTYRSQAIEVGVKYYPHKAWRMMRDGVDVMDASGTYSTIDVQGLCTAIEMQPFLHAADPVIRQQARLAIGHKLQAERSAATARGLKR